MCTTVAINVALILLLQITSLAHANPNGQMSLEQMALDNLPKDNLQVSQAHANRLMRYLFKYYNLALRPVYNDSEPVHVIMHLWFKQVLKVDEIDQILTIYCWTEQHWLDQFLRWDPSQFGGITVLNVPAEQIWKPDILVYNNADMNIAENEVSTNVVLNYTGGILYFRAVISRVTCNLDMTYFPFDKQDFRYGVNIKYYDCCVEPFPDVTYQFRLERNPSYYILNLILPSVFITVVTMVGFFTPYSSTGENTEKVSLGVTALLSLAIILLMVADKMPATSKVIPLIGKYYIGLIWLIFAATIITTITLRLQSKGNAGKRLAPIYRKIFFDYVAKVLLMDLQLPEECEFVDTGEPVKVKGNGAVHDFSMETVKIDSLPHPITQQPLLVRNQLSSNSSSTDSFAPSDTPPLEQRHIVGAQPKKPYVKQTHAPHARSWGDEASTLLSSVARSTSAIQLHFTNERRYLIIQNEWAQLARVVERMLMITFVSGTAAFVWVVTLAVVPTGKSGKT